MAIDRLIEKPSVEEAPSNLAISGRYVLKPEVFDILAELPASAGGDIQLTDAINSLCDIQEVFAFKFKGERYEVGELGM